MRLLNQLSQEADARLTSLTEPVFAKVITELSYPAERDSPSTLSILRSPVGFSFEAQLIREALEECASAVRALEGVLEEGSPGGSQAGSGEGSREGSWKGSREAA